MTAASRPQVVTLRSGDVVRLRQVRPGDVSALARAYANLGEQSRYRRFFTTMPKLPESTLKAAAKVDHENHEALDASRSSRTAGQLAGRVHVPAVDGGLLRPPASARADPGFEDRLLGYHRARARTDQLDPGRQIFQVGGEYGRPDCVATLSDDRVVIDGRKADWISNGTIAEVCILYCAADTGAGPTPNGAASSSSRWIPQGSAAGRRWTSSGNGL